MLLSRISAACAAISLSAITFFIQTPHALASQSILAPEPIQYLGFGVNIAADSDVAVIGAIGSEQAGPLTGSAYIARRDSTGAWNIEANLQQSPMVQLGNFGHAVAIDGRTAVVGAPYGGFDGRAYIFRQNDDGDWAQEVMLMAPAMPHPVIRFGSEIVVQGDEIVIASQLDEIEQMWVFVYRRSAEGNWEFRQALQPIGDISLGMGSALAIHENRLVIGNIFSAAATLDPDLSLAGAAYIFDRDANGVWHQAALLTASDAAMLNYFGSAVAVEGDTVVVGAVGRNFGTMNMAGAVYTFQRTAAGEWFETDIFTSESPEFLSQTGEHLDLKDGRLAVHSWVGVNGMNTGKVEVFRKAGTGWEHDETFAAQPPMQSDLFGLSAVIADGQMLMFENTPDDAGSVKVVQLSPPTRGDLNCDGMVDMRDIAPFVSVLLDAGNPTPNCDAGAADVDGDGLINGRDVLRLVEKVL